MQKCSIFLFRVYSHVYTFENIFGKSVVHVQLCWRTSQPSSPHLAQTTRLVIMRSILWVLRLSWHFSPELIALKAVRLIPTVAYIIFTVWRRTPTLSTLYIHVFHSRVHVVSSKGFIVFPSIVRHTKTVECKCRHQDYLLCWLPKQWICLLRSWQLSPTERSIQSSVTTRSWVVYVCNTWKTLSRNIVYLNQKKNFTHPCTKSRSIEWQHWFLAVRKFFVYEKWNIPKSWKKKESVCVKLFLWKKLWFV